jgi:AcrR family transcriptional regulator
VTKQSLRGRATRDQIIDAAIPMASATGLGSLTIGALAERLEMSKSGLFAHFGAKDALQVAVIDAVAARFAAFMEPALSLNPGPAKLNALMARWVLWSQSDALPGGCPLAGAAFELDGCEGPARDRVSAALALWRRTLVRVGAQARGCGLPRSFDAEACASLIFALYFGQHVERRLLGAHKAGARACATLARWLDISGAAPASPAA